MTRGVLPARWDRCARSENALQFGGGLGCAGVVPFSSVMENAVPGGYVGGRPKDERKLSTDPKQIRVRLRRAAKGDKKRDGRMERDIEMLYRKPIEEWDMEELSHGRPRNVAGTFAGRPPSWITPTIQKEAKKRLLDETLGSLAGHIGKAVKAIGELIESEEVDENGKPIVDARTKLAAATFTIEHFLGKPKAIIEVQADDFTKQAIASAIVLDDGLPEDHFVLEGEFTEPDEEEGDDDDDTAGE